MGATNTPIQLSYFIPDIASVLATYSRLRWWRATSENGVYAPVTAQTAEVASLLTPFETPYQVEALGIELDVNGTEVNHTFATTDPTSNTDAAADLAAASILIDCPVEGAQFRIQTVNTGRDNYLCALGGDALASLGLAVGDAALGLDADTVLVAGTHEYFYTDPHSDPSYWYRAQFVNDSTTTYSELGVPFSADQPEAVPKSHTIVCYLRLADLSGCPVPCRKVRFHNVPQPNRVDAVNGLWGIFRNVAEMETDRNGYAEIRLLKGALVDVEIVGSGFVRRIEVPDEVGVDSVDLLDPALVVNDEFGIQQSTVTPAIRTS